MVMYGLALPKQHQVENPHTTRDLFHPRSGPKSSDWESTTRNMQNSLFNKVYICFSSQIIVINFVERRKA